MTFDWIAHYEDLAERFWRDTGLMAPGKSEPMEMYGGEAREEERRTKWREWIMVRGEEAWNLWHEKHGWLPEVAR